LTRGAEQAEGDVQRFAEASVVVVVDFPCVHDGANPELALPSARIREADVVAGQELTEHGDDAVQQERLVCPVDQCEQAIAAVDEPVAATGMDSRRAQRCVEQLIEHGPQFSLHPIGAAGGPLDVQRDDDPAARGV